MDESRGARRYDREYLLWQSTVAIKSGPVGTRKEIPSEFLCTKNGEAGPVAYSNAELMALDLIQYEQHAGGYSVVATMLEELQGAFHRAWAC